MKLSTHAHELFTRLRSRNGEREPITSPRTPIVRRMDFGFAEAEIPRHWLGGSMVGTALGNALNLIFPDGERFFVRSVNHFLPEIEDPELRERVKKFFGQEGSHAREHERLYEVLRAHGYAIDELLVRYRHIAYEQIAPRVSPELRLSVTAALEHFTATFAIHALTTGLLDEHAPPIMAELLKWHAAEEIEHKDVAFDVLQAVDDSYALRVRGLVVATLVLSGFWTWLTIELLRQEPELDARRMIREWIERGQTGQGPGGSMPLAFLQYLAPGFHPSKVASDELALAYLDQIGRRYA